MMKSFVPVVGAGIIATLFLCQPVFAAHILIANCLEKAVKICAYDNKQLWAVATVLSYNVKPGDFGEYRCKANCAFSISHKNDSNCQNGLWLDHSWGSGNYQLVGLEKAHEGTANETYKSSNLQKGNVYKCPPAAAAE